MNKRGQLYILAALILLLVIFWVSLKTNMFQQREVSPTFDQLSRNYENELNKLVNTLLTEGATPQELSEEVSELSGDFVYTYAKQKDPDFGLVYVLSNQDIVTVENTLNSRVVVEGKELASPEESCIEGDVSGASAQLAVGRTKKWCVENIDPATLVSWEDSFTPISQELTGISSGDTIIINIGDNDYYFTIGDSVELKAIVRRESEGQVQIYTTGQES